MSTFQRRHGEPAVVYPMHTVTDNRDQETRIVDMDNPISVKAAFVSNTGTTVSMHIDPLPDGLDMAAQVSWAGGMWNAGPPAFHNGATRHTRYWAIELKRVQAGRLN
jgi:hypothetical protein